MKKCNNVRNEDFLCIEDVMCPSTKKIVLRLLGGGSDGL